MADSDTQFKSRFRGFLWPIYKHELFKFVPMIVLFFLISFNYHLLRITKDTLIITAPQAGAEVLPFLKVWAILPSAIFMTYLFTRACNRFSKEHIFYAMTLIFLTFFIIFTFFLYPHKETLQLDKTADFLQKQLPEGMKGLISIIRYWVYALFYIFSECWSTIMFSVMLWGFANDVTAVNESKRFYPLFGIGINAAGIFAGQYNFLIATYMKSHKIFLYPLFYLFGANSNWDQTLFSFMFTIMLVTLCALAVYKFLHIYAFKERKHSFFEKDTLIKGSKKQAKSSLTETIKYVLSSKYLLYIALIVVSYNIAINLTEILWKAEMRQLFPSPSEYTAYMGQITFWIGILATFASYLFSGNFIRNFGWKAAALITPLIFLIMGTGFFYFLFSKEYFSTSHLLLGLSPLTLAVFFGSAQNILSRASKYTVFDATKEIAFVPLSDEAKIKGKSAIDGIGSRLGKSGGSLIMQILLIFFQTAIAASSIIFIILLILIPLWIIAVNRLNKQFQQESKTNVA